MILRDVWQNPLPHNRGGAFPTRMLFLDTETRAVPWQGYEKHVFVLGWTCYLRRADKTHGESETWCLWRDPEALCRYIDELIPARCSLYVYTHNAFFDMQASRFYFYFSRWGWKYDFLYDKGLTYIFTIRKGGRSIKVVSTTNYFPFSLRVLGDHVGLAKMDTDPLTASEDELIPYCRRDVEILLASMRQYMGFNREHDTGRFAMTRASQSFTCYRHRFMHTPIFVHQHERIVELEREAYFGGRVESFFIGKPAGGPFLFMDVNSMYPFVMRERLYPSKLLFYTDRMSLADLDRYSRTACVIAHVDVETTEPVYAVRKNGKLMFPVGRVRTYLCTEGVRCALDHRHIKAVHRVAVYQADFLFTDYIDYFYPLKSAYAKEGNILYKTIVKIYLNSLYGKFGQKKPILETLDEPGAFDLTRRECISLVTGQRWVETSGFGKRIIEKGEENGDRSSVAIASHVTEYARFHLWRAIQRVGIDRVLYCDTDSLALREADVKRLSPMIDESRLGYFSLQEKTNTLVLRGAKDYATDSGEKLKGVPKTAERIDERTYRYMQFLGQASHMRHGDVDGVLTREVVKTCTRSYDKAHVHVDGSTRPYCFSDF